MSKRLEKKLQFVARAFVWENRFQKTRQVVRLVRGHVNTAKDAKQAVSFWARLLLPKTD